MKGTLIYRQKYLLTSGLMAMLVFLGCVDTDNSHQKSFNTSKSTKSSSIMPIEGMVWIPGGTFHKGAVPQDPMAMQHEKPRHLVEVEGLYMDIHPVTNQQFSAFVEATGYITIAERDVDWDEIRK